MEKDKSANNQRKKSRPVSELISIFDHQQAKESRIEQWRSENALNLTKLQKTYDKEKPTTSPILSENTVISKSSESVFNSDVPAEEDKKHARGKALGKTRIMLTLKPKAGSDETDISLSSVEPKKKDVKFKEKQNIKDSPMKVPQVLQEKPKEDDSKTDNTTQEDEDVESDESCNRKKFPLDDSLAVLRREMHSLRKQDVELMSQLLALNSSIQDFKSNSNSSSMSNFSDISDAETDVTQIEANPSVAHAWHQRESSGSDGSDFETSGYERRPRGRPSKQTGVNRDSMDSEVSGYYSNASPNGSNLSLNGFDDNAGYYYSPLSMHTIYRRQQTWLNQDYVIENGKAGSDPALNRCIPESGGSILHSAVQSRAFFPGDERAKKISFQQKQIYTHRNSAIGIHSPITSHSRSGSDHSISGYDVDSDGNRYASIQPTSGRPQKWQRSRSSYALNSDRRASSPVQNTIKIDLRNNQPMPGTAIELVLPIQPLVPTRRSSAVRMAERRPLTKLNTLNKRQSMIW